MSSINNTTSFYPNKSLQLSPEENVLSSAPPTGSKREAVDEYNDEDNGDNQDRATRARLNDTRSSYHHWGASAKWTSSVLPSESCNANTKNADEWLQEFCSRYDCTLESKTNPKISHRTITYRDDPQEEPHLRKIAKRLNDRGFRADYLGSEKTLVLPDDQIHDLRTFSLATLDEETMQELREKGDPILKNIRRVTEMNRFKTARENGTIDPSTPFDSTAEPNSQKDLETTLHTEKMNLQVTYSEFFRICQERGFEPADVFKDEEARTQVRLYARTNYLNLKSTTNNTNETTEKNNTKGTTDTCLDFKTLMSQLNSQTTF